MQGYFKICNAVYWVSLAVWLAAIVAAGVAAANVFSTLGDTPLRLEQYAAYPAQEHPRLAAGLIMEGVFFTVDLIQFVAIPLTVLMLVAQLSVFGMPLKSVANLGRALCIVIAAGMFTFHVIAVAPTMNHHLRAYWDAAKMGDVALAREHQAAFNEDHPTAEAILRINLILLVAAVGASAAAGPPPAKPAVSRLQEPGLLSHR